MAARALTPSTTAFLLSLLLFTTLLSSARADCPYISSVVESLCKAKTGEDGSTQVGEYCCKILDPLGPLDAITCICKGNPNSNLQDLYGLLGGSCRRPVPLPLFSCDMIGPFNYGKMRYVTN